MPLLLFPAKFPPNIFSAGILKTVDKPEAAFQKALDEGCNPRDAYFSDRLGDGFRTREKAVNGSLKDRVFFIFCNIFPKILEKKPESVFV